MIGANQISFMAIPGVRIEQADIIWSPSTLILKIEHEFHIQGRLFFKSKSPQYSLPRFLFTYILEKKMKLSPDIIDTIYDIDHAKCWHARKTIKNMLDSKTPKYNYIRCSKIIQSINKWDVTEIVEQLEFKSKSVSNVQVTQRWKNTLEQSMAVAQSTRQLSAVDATEQKELKLQ